MTGTHYYYLYYYTNYREKFSSGSKAYTKKSYREIEGERKLSYLVWKLYIACLWRLQGSYLLNFTSNFYDWNTESNNINRIPCRYGRTCMYCINQQLSLGRFYMITTRLFILFLYGSFWLSLGWQRTTQPENFAFIENDMLNAFGGNYYADDEMLSCLQKIVTNNMLYTL